MLEFECNAYNLKQKRQNGQVFDIQYAIRSREVFQLHLLYIAHVPRLTRRRFAFDVSDQIADSSGKTKDKIKRLCIMTCANAS